MERTKTPTTKMTNNNTFYEKAFAGFSALCILFAGLAAKKTLGFNTLKFDALLSSDLTIIVFSGFCCLVILIYFFNILDFKCYRYAFIRTF